MRTDHGLAADFRGVRGSLRLEASDGTGLDRYFRQHAALAGTGRELRGLVAHLLHGQVTDGILKCFIEPGNRMGHAFLEFRRVVFDASRKRGASGADARAVTSRRRPPKAGAMDRAGTESASRLVIPSGLRFWLPLDPSSREARPDGTARDRAGALIRVIRDNPRQDRDPR